MDRISSNELLAALRSPYAAETLTALVVVDVDNDGPPPTGDDRDRLVSLPVVMVGVGAVPDGWARVLDLLVEENDLPAIAQRFEQTPLAATVLALLLRGSENRSVEEGLVAESAAYSTLQAGPEFTRWRAAHAIRDRPVETEPAVRLERIGDVIVVRLSRPHVRNAFSARMRDELLEALGVAQADPALTVELRGDGPSFSAGGDLDEFGTRPDPATAHLARLKASPARVIALLHDRITAYLHGACYGSGIELPAFAGRVIAARDTQIALPELDLGLIPGAGGTVSIVRRIGRHRTASLVLSGMAIDAPTALEWGLVDAIE